MYQRILVPLDGSTLAQQTLPYVRILARGWGCPIELLRIIEPLPPAGLTDPAREVWRHRTLSRLKEEANEYLEAIAESLSQDGHAVSYKVHDDLAVSTEVHLGTPALRILNEAEEVPNTLIVMSSHGRSGVTRWLLGSTTAQIIHGSTNPLLIVRPKGSQSSPAEDLPNTLETIVVPLDGSSVAEQVLPHVVAFARSLDSRVSLVRVTPTEGEYHRYTEHWPMDELGAASSTIYEQLTQSVDSPAKEYLHAVGQELLKEDILSVDEHLVHGDPAGEIVDLAQETPHCLVAMTTHGRAGVGRWILGSVADRVVRHSGSPVLLIRAKGTDDD